MRTLGKRTDLANADNLAPLGNSIERPLEIFKALSSNGGRQVICGSKGADGEDLVHCETGEDVEAMRGRLAKGEVDELRWYVAERRVAPGF